MLSTLNTTASYRTMHDHVTVAIESPRYGPLMIFLQSRSRSSEVTVGSTTLQGLPSRQVWSLSV